MESQENNSVVEVENKIVKPDATARRFVSASVHSGPLPPPEMLAKYEQILPGAAERIFIMAETQSKHRQLIESTIIKSGSRDSLLGMIFGLIIGLTAIISGSIVAIKGQPWSGTFLGSFGIVSLVGAFIYGSQGIQQETKEKNESKKQ